MQAVIAKICSIACSSSRSCSCSCSKRRQIEHEQEREHDYDGEACLSFPSPLIRFARMNKTVIEVQVRAVLPTSGGCAVFIGNNDKVFIIYVDQTVGSAITMFMRDVSKERPLTHDLMGHLMTALGAKVERVIINDLKNATYYARMIIRAENELQQKKIIELDGRPSDCIAMATQQKAPMYVSQDVWDEVDDMSDVLRKMEEDGLKPDIESESESESTEEE
jgi:bifunctional DNase/RNase